MRGWGGKNNFLEHMAYISDRCMCVRFGTWERETNNVYIQNSNTMSIKNAIINLKKMENHIRKEV